MSIINEALKKAGQKISPETDSAGKTKSSTDRTTVKSSPTPSAPPNVWTVRKSDAVKLHSEVEAARKGSAVNWGPFFMLAVFAIIAGPIVAPLIYDRPHLKSETPNAVSMGAEVSPAMPWTRQGGERPAAQFAIEEAPKPFSSSAGSGSEKRAPLPPLNLTGVVYSEADSYCLINGKILKTGGWIGGATLEKITPNEVTLDYHGEKVVLPVENA